MRQKKLVVFWSFAFGAVLAGCGSGGGPHGSADALLPGATSDAGRAVSTSMVVFGYNDLGMHCMNQDFSEFMILPPFNTLRAQVVDRSGEDPRIVSDSSVTVSYQVPGNTRSATKTNFWRYAQPLLGLAAPLPVDTGLTGHKLAGTMTPTGNNDWSVTGIPITPVTDAGQLDPYQLATVTVSRASRVVATARPVVPVSWEIQCNLCHTTPGISVGTDILRKHDRKHGTRLEQSRPVTCGACHGQPPLGLAGKSGVPTLSSAMHNSHAGRMSAAVLANAGMTEPCYACHPGSKTACQRDVHLAKGITCSKCHVSMAAVGSPSRRPWVDEPRCGSAGCHAVKGHAYEEPGKLYRDSRGHMGIHCAACHGSPHAITPTVTPRDNVQAIALQGHAGTIDTCTVCHRTKPTERFPHSRGDG